MNKKRENSLRDSAKEQLARTPPMRHAGDLLHEIQVLQIGLKTQKEKLHLAQAALKESRDCYVDLYESAPVGYLTITRNGTIGAVNLTGARLLGMERKKMLRRRFDTFVLPEHRDHWSNMLADVLQRSDTTSCELTLAKTDGEFLWAHLISQRMMTNDMPSAVRVALIDITRQRQAEDALREWQQFVEYASWGMAIGDVEEQTIRRINPAFARMHGYTVDEMPGMPIEKLHPPASHADLANLFKSILETGHHSFECVRLRKDGSTFPAIVDATVVKGFDGKFNYIVSVKDITEIKYNEKRMRELTGHIQNIREEEKANIAREIHDDLGGTLTALKMEAYWLAEEMSANREAEPLLKHVELISQLTENAVNVTRRVITGLRPTILDDLGLLAALEWQAEQFHKHTGIACRVNSIEDKVNLDKRHSIALFRIFQETLTNVTRHSGASRVEVEFRCGEEEVMLSVSDDGRGLPDGHTLAPTSYGVRGMRERVVQLGGSIKFDSPSGVGFSVTVTLPLHVEMNQGDKA